ncbi:MAG: glycosyltransferase [Caldithrix sp.]|nr:glycosyltransferase [Caldithrix sp.]
MRRKTQLSEAMQPNVTKKFAILTSYPLDVRVGSGVVRMIEGYRDILCQAGYQTDVIAPPYKTLNDKQLTRYRIQYNHELKHINFDDYACVIASDFDGYLIENMPAGQYVVLNAGLLGDIVRFETGRAARILTAFAQLEKRNLQKAGMIIVPTKYTKRKLVQYYGIEPSKIEVIPLGIHFKYWHKNIATERGMTTKEKNILCVARQYPRKGIADLIRAFRSAADRYGGAHLHLVGGGPQEDKNKKLVESLELPEKVTFHGDINDNTKLSGLYQSAHIFVLPSYHETFGIAFAEAMAAGVPVIAYKSTAIPELIKNQFNGLLVKTGSVGGLYKAMEQLFRSDELRNRIIDNAQKTAAQLDWKIISSQVLDKLKIFRNKFSCPTVSPDCFE